MARTVTVERRQELINSTFHSLNRAREGLGNLTAQVAPHLQADTYSSILVDQRGGTLPALVIGGLAWRWAMQTSKWPPRMIDLPGGQRWHQTDKKRYLKSIKPLVGPKRSLVVTEVIAGGEASGNMYAELMRNGIELDVATFQTYCSNDEYHRRWKLPRKNRRVNTDSIRIFSGMFTEDPEVGDIINAAPLVLARSLEEDREQYRSFKFTADEHVILMNAARQYLSGFTDELYAQYFPPLTSIQ